MRFLDSNCFQIGFKFGSGIGLMMVSLAQTSSRLLATLLLLINGAHFGHSNRSRPDY